jgi:hypothetical protein
MKRVRITESQLKGLVKRLIREEMQKLNEVEVEYTEGLAQILQKDFDFKRYSGDNSAYSIAKKDDPSGRILGYYAMPNSQHYSIKQGSPLYGKKAIWTLSNDNELATAIKNSEGKTGVSTPIGFTTI